jgi:hypothetical protein
MIKIQRVGNYLEKSLKKGEIKICHWPNRSFCWAVKNQIGQILYFDFGNNNGYCPKIVEKFSKSKNIWN